MTKRALETADTLGKLEQKTGISVETLSTLAFGARTADVEQEQLQKGLIQFVKTLDDYNQGVKTARDATRQLFGNADALKGLSETDALQKVINGLAKLEPGAKRTGLALEFFKKSGAELLPLIDDLGTGGFDELAKKAERLGVKIDRDLVQAAQRANDAVRDLKTKADGLALRFAAGLAPGLADAAEFITEELGAAGNEGFKRMGESAGTFVKLVVAGFSLIGQTLAFVLAEGEELWEHFGDTAKDQLRGIAVLAKGAFSRAVTGSEFTLLSDDDLKQFEAGGNKFLNRLQAFIEKMGKTIDKVFTLPSAGTGGRGKGDDDRSKDLEQSDKEAKARLALEESLLDNALKLQKAHLALQEQQERDAFEKNERSLREHFEERKRITREAAEAEVAALRERLDVLERLPLQQGETKDARTQKTQDLRTQIAVRQLELTKELGSLTAEQRKATEDNAKALLDFDRQLLEAKGQRFAAERAALDEQIAKLDELLVKEGVAEEERKRRLAEARSVGEQKINFAEIQAEAEKALAALDAEIQAIRDKVATGVLTQFQGEQQILQVERERLPVLEEIGVRIRGAAITDEQIAAAERYNQALGQVRVSTDAAGQAQANFTAQLEQAVQADIASFFSQGIQNAESFGDAMRGLALSVVQSIQQIISQMIAWIITTKLLGGLLKSLGGIFGGFGLAGGGQVPGKATGGLIRGPGSSTSDSIPIRVSRGEFIVRAAVVKQPGMLEFLRDLNQAGLPALRRRTMRGFAEGGLVEVTPGAAGPTGRADLTVDLDDALVLKRLEASPMFARVVVRTLERNRKAANGALGLGVKSL
ncbi:MAG TPA: hypothetical protein VNK82_05900 [Terriglobales bacterium]|nr:hypothetical protein [Terriglobales bacterium]